MISRPTTSKVSTQKTDVDPRGRQLGSNGSKELSNKHQIKFSAEDVSPIGTLRILKTLEVDIF